MPNVVGVGTASTRFDSKRTRPGQPIRLRELLDELAIVRIVGASSRVLVAGDVDGQLVIDALLEDYMFRHPRAGTRETVLPRFRSPASASSADYSTTEPVPAIHRVLSCS